MIAAIGFVAFALVPFLKYPATPPAVGSGDSPTRVRPLSLRQRPPWWRASCWAVWSACCCCNTGTPPRPRVVTSASSTPRSRPC
ncbi:CbtA family protein [Mycolicibacter algericus]|uniref:CbtA family protein n=1 Tax=Mycolicibacter algericus TaxID=1288388 RepID=UPI003C743E84